MSRAGQARQIDLVSLFHHVTRGRVFELGHVLKSGIPGVRAHPSFFFSLYRRHGDVIWEEGVSSANDVFFLGGHVGTHIDALGHVSRQNKFFDGAIASESQTGPGGLSVHAIDAVDPVIRRGILLDVASCKNCDALPPGYTITPADLEEACSRHGVKMLTGDAVFVRTGWAKYWSDSDRFAGLSHPTAGVGLTAATWLLDRQAALVGADNVAFEPIHPPTRRLPVHGLVIADAGVPIIEMLNLEELSTNEVYEFVFIALPLRIAGGTGSPIRPVAVV